ncbi:MAG: hypothetical protein N3J91_13815 [Verrucomicrobiae bacterium]|nr:hypothetical protein [Verrucomicrobiae bacterium]
MGTGLKEAAPARAAANEESQTLRDLYLQQAGSSPQNFERDLLFACAYAPALVRLAWRLDPDFFLHDLQLIRAVSLCRNFGDCRHEVEAFRRANPPRGFLRKTLRVRLSGQKLLRMASRLYLTKTLPSRNANAGR